METRPVIAGVQGTRGWCGEGGCAGKGQALRQKCSGLTDVGPGGYCAWSSLFPDTSDAGETVQSEPGFKAVQQ